MITRLKSVRLTRTYAATNRLTAGESGIRSLAILDNGYLEIVPMSGPTVLRPPTELWEAVAESAEAVLSKPEPETVLLPERHDPPEGGSRGLPAGDTGYTSPRPYEPPEKAKAGKKKGR
jgi:hypothetical protein